MPSVDSLEALDRAVAGFEVTNLALVIEPSALAAARRSLDESGLLLLGEVHGVRENPLVIHAMMQAFGLTALALEWPDELAPVIAAYLAGGDLADHPALWLGDGRITAGHLAVLRERAAVGQLELTLFDGVASPDASWSQRDEAMAGRILARAAADAGKATARADAGKATARADAGKATARADAGKATASADAAPAGGSARVSSGRATTAGGSSGRATTAGGMLAVAGNAHTPTRPTSLGIPLGACLAGQRPGVRDIRIGYGSGHFYNLRPRRFRPQPGMLGLRRHQVRLHLHRGSLILDLPEPSEAIVPHRPAPA